MVFNNHPASQSVANGKELLSPVILGPFKVSAGDFENMAGRLSRFVPVCLGRRILWSINPEAGRTLTLNYYQLLHDLKAFLTVKIGG